MSGKEGEIMRKIIYLSVSLLLLMTSISGKSDCVNSKVDNISDKPNSTKSKSSGICTLLKQHPAWLQAVQDTEKKWGVPAEVQLAIIKTESNFDANAKNSQSTATGFAQVLNKSWEAYLDANNKHDSRNDFHAAIDYIGWYADQVRRYADINPTNAYKLYLAYHEGIGGYHHLANHPKPEVFKIAQNVKQTAEMYAQQMVSCAA